MVVLIKEGLARILKGIPETKVKSRRLLNSLGYVLAENILASFHYPPFTRSRMDGYAVFSEDFVNVSSVGELSLKITGILGAGSQSTVTLYPGETIQIMTGAALPPGADAVVPFERVERKGEYAVFTQSVEPGENISFEGEEVKKGQKILSRGSLIRPGDSALMAAMGKDIVDVYSRPKVGILATGEELIPLYRKRDFGKIYNSNSYMVGSQTILSGGKPVYLGTAGDHKDKISEILEKQLSRLSVIITTGGTARGKYDLTEEVFLSLGAQILFNRVSMKPGNYMVAARKGHCFLFGLSGSPSAAFVSFQQFVRPLLWKLQGLKEIDGVEVTARLAGEIKGVFNEDRFYKAFTGVRQGEFYVEPKRHGFHSFAAVNSLIHIPPGEGPFQEGDEVSIQLLDLPGSNR